MDISIIEFVVYGLIAYSGVVLLIISAFRDAPSTKSQSIVRSIWLIPPIIAAAILAGSGVNIDMETEQTFTYNETSNILMTNSTTTNSFTLQNSVWVPFHFMLMAIMLVYVVLQMLTLLTKIE